MIFPVIRSTVGFIFPMDGNLCVPAHVVDLFWDSRLEVFVWSGVWMEINLIMSQWGQEEQSPAPERWKSRELVTATWQQRSGQTHLNQLHIVSEKRWDKCKTFWSLISEIHFTPLKKSVSRHKNKLVTIWDLVWKCVSSSSELLWKNWVSSYYEADYHYLSSRFDFPLSLFLIYNLKQSVWTEV